ncbi:ABC transporter ATP-binding protein [Microbacterium sp. GbtcB4]|uniref:ABC transporter ATP-binding protein n=1 Tax=Microbacterium sp. GbtcB4 TaxID=2824749 RepID=UPI001C2F2CD9
MKSIWKTLVDLFKVLPDGATRFYIGYAIVTGALALLDTLALGLIVLSVTPLASGEPIKLPVIGELPAAAAPWIFGIVCILFLLKSGLAILLHWVATRRFAAYELTVGDELFRSYTRSSWEARARYSTAEVTRIVDGSMASTNTGFILPLSQVPVNLLTFISVLGVLVVAQPLTAAVAFVYLLGFSLFMLFVITRRAREAGLVLRRYVFRVATLITEMVEALKEVTLRNKLDEIGGVVTDYRRNATRARANASFLSIVPKYAFEAALIGGFLIVGGTAFLAGGAENAVVAVAMFAATGFRMIPAITTLQSSFTTASINEVHARDVISELTRESGADRSRETASIDSETLKAAPRVLELRDVSFSYPGTGKNVLEHLNLAIPFGSTLAIVGPSGAGKSTLIDVLLGLSQPSSGELHIDGQPLSHVLNQWRAHVGYVPQRVALFDASVAQNVALTWGNDFDEEKVTRSLEQAQLAELVTRGAGIHELIGERGFSLSGGQQQRLGIARALYADPLVMVMDEATSSLDTATERRIVEAMRELQGDVTFISVAHRLATVRDYDRICYLSDGGIRGLGTFEEVVEQVPDFAHQAALAGLLERGDR